MKKACFILLMLIILQSAYSAYFDQYKDKGRIIIREFKNAPFPHKNRMKGLIYNGVHYEFKDHYNDSNVFIFIPNNYDLKDTNDLFFYFHGWDGNINDCVMNYKLLDSFIISGKKAIFIFPETAKNAKDSFAGKLSDEAGFKNLTVEIIDYLHKSGLIKSSKTGNIILAGHSGGYRAISSILDKGGMNDNISEVLLLDALYDDNQKFFNWIKKDRKRFISVITDEGSTKRNVYLMQEVLYQNDINFYKKTGNELSLKELYLNKIVFLYTSLRHDDVVWQYLSMLLTTSGLRD